MLPFEVLDPIITAALREDFQDRGDVTTDCTIPAGRQGSARFISKARGIICGLAVSSRVFELIDPRLQVTFHVTDGDGVTAGHLFGIVSGSLASILKAERTVLNLMQRMSGVATLTAAFVRAVEGTGTVILDTRKTTPGLRVLEKYAVTCGGGRNHRMGLYDMAMIKDNHIDAAGSITAAVGRFRKESAARGIAVPVEVETRTLEEVREAVRLGVDRIMLDNMDCPTMKKAVDIIVGRCETEASGNMTLDRVREVAETGVDFISVGALTHSVPSLDISLQIESVRNS
ncbi:carboxylating nicotinate-nucleotide diphosphorylase [bacterium]|nr:carboxylating nicotinate-nucleotide diphosphorylase [bacterium]